MTKEKQDKIKIVKPDVAVQYGMGSSSGGNKLTNLWMETTKPEHCNLACPYCYAGGGERQVSTNALSLEQWLDVLDRAKSIGVTSIGIPGAGEPFHPGAIDRTMSVLDKCKDLGIYVTLFTTGQFITDGLADKLSKLPVELMLKGNSMIPEVQDAFVSDSKRGRIVEGYGESRNRALELLINKGFNDAEKCQKEYGRKSRMALVTSIMADHVTEEQLKAVSPEEVKSFIGLLEKYNSLGVGESYVKALGEVSNVKFKGTSNFGEISYLMAFSRINNIIFDVDSVLEKGRGASCHLGPRDERMKAKFNELQIIDKEVFDYEWGVNTTYVGVACERPRRHLYISYSGEIRPCIGATEVKLGNVKDIDLMDAWQTREMQTIRAKKYNGKCADQCANFEEIDSRTGNPRCNSCLGRCTENLTNESLLKDGYVKTIGCWNFRDKKEGRK